MGWIGAGWGVWGRRRLQYTRSWLVGMSVKEKVVLMAARMREGWRVGESAMWSMPLPYFGPQRVR